MNRRTQIVHAGVDRDPYTGAASIPIYQTSTYAQKDPERLSRYDYSRSDNPTREALELAIAELEGGAVGLAFGSGMAAISSVLLLLQPGDHLVVSRHIYGGTFRVLTTLFKRWGLKSEFVNCEDPEQVRRAITPSTRALFVETPSNPLLQITDLRAMAAIAREHGLLALTDNTFMTPCLQRPLEFGFDVVMHSATKFLGGHSDVVAGLVVTSDAALGRRLKSIQNGFGAILGPQDSWLTLRGMRTLGVRMLEQQRNADSVARRLLGHPAVQRVWYPGLEQHPGSATHLAQSDGGGAVLSFDLGSRAAATAMLRRVRLPVVGVSLGGVESILTYPPTMSHASMPPDERALRGIGEGLVRLSVGLEDPEDLVADLEQALNPIG